MFATDDRARSDIVRDRTRRVRPCGELTRFTLSAMSISAVSTGRRHRSRTSDGGRRQTTEDIPTGRVSRRHLREHIELSTIHRLTLLGRKYARGAQRLCLASYAVTSEQRVRRTRYFAVERVI